MPHDVSVHTGTYAAIPTRQVQVEDDACTILSFMVNFTHKYRSFFTFEVQTMTV